MIIISRAYTTAKVFSSKGQNSSGNSGSVFSEAGPPSQSFSVFHKNFGPFNHLDLSS